MKGPPSPCVSAAEPRLPGDAREREAQQGSSCGGEAPLTPDLHHPAAQEVLKRRVCSWKSPGGNCVKSTVKEQSGVLVHTPEG